MPRLFVQKWFHITSQNSPSTWGEDDAAPVQLATSESTLLIILNISHSKRITRESRAGKLPHSITPRTCSWIFGAIKVSLHSQDHMSHPTPNLSHLTHARRKLSHSSLSQQIVRSPHPNRRHWNHPSSQMIRTSVTGSILTSLHLNSSLSPRIGLLPAFLSWIYEESYHEQGDLLNKLQNLS
jgi:hypothetical protein